jgi:hypothetical protein
VTGVAERTNTDHWKKYPGNPVLGGELGTCFDMSVDVRDGLHRMWFSWRPRRGIGYAESQDGLHLTARDEVVLGPTAGDPEGVQMSRPYVLVENGQLTMWYAAHDDPSVVIARATSQDGIAWERTGVAYIGFANGFEDSAIGIARSRDGVNWARHADNPVISRGAAGEFDSINVY